MELIIDVGNSYSKFAIFSNNKIVKFYFYPTNKNLSFSFLKKEKFDIVIFSSVVSYMSNLIKKEISKIKKVKIIDINELDKNIKINIKEKKKDIGADLLADLIATKKIYKGPAIIFDIGTVSKVLALDKNNTFIGANFFNGLDNAKEALDKGTDALPNVKIKMNNSIIGKNTFECINNGVIYSLLFAIDGFIKEYKKVLGKNAKVIFTGGGSFIIKSKLKNYIYDKYLTLLGIHYIYKENK